MLSALLLILAAEAVPAAATETAMVEPDPKAMSQKEIRTYNAKLPRTHPFYIRCVSTAEIGSLVKRTYSCRTNRQWKASDENGNQNARDTYEQMTSKSWNTSG